MFTVLRLPGATRAFLPSLLGRLALAMGGLAIVLAVQSHTGSFAAAGIAAGAFGFANVFAAPLRARAIDQWGQRRALTPLGLAQAAVFLGFAFATNTRGTSALGFVALSAGAGLVAPPLGASMRTIWTTLTTAGPQRTHALSLDATADELVFIVGPLVAAALATAFSPAYALLAAATAVLAGTLGLISSRASGSLRGAPAVAGRAERPLRRPGFIRVLVVLLGVGGVLGTIEITAPAVAVAAHDAAISGWLLAALSAGSAAGGLIYGHISWRGTLGSRMRVLAIAIGVLACGIGLVNSVPGFAIGVAATGLFLAPSIITGYLAAEHLVPQHTLTEASVWTNTALNLGASIANAIAGAIVAGPGVAWAMLAAGLFAILTATATPRARLHTGGGQPAPSPSDPHL
ncbi:MFS transporter [Lysinimonas soli]|uniref:MFS transporter n=1 Tax=Lysinimonas soli TaxID=1074233 RepID=A0ABW0NLU5_9MICO